MQVVSMNENKKILMICGTLSQTAMMYEISRYLQYHDVYFTPFYGDRFIQTLAHAGLMGFCSLGGKHKQNTENFLRDHRCQMDYEGRKSSYDLVVTCSDLIIPNNIRQTAVIHIQEGMTDPENYRYHIVKTLKLPRYFANTSMMGLSDAYDKFCIMGHGWREIFINKGVDPEKLVVTGLPNFDNVDRYRENDFPHSGFVLAATASLRETFKYENRIHFIKNALQIANGRKLIFKLHPIENRKRAIREIERYAPDSLIYTDGNINEMIANCDALVTRYSTVVLVAVALGKTVFSDFTPEELRRMTPLQNGGTSGKRIAEICEKYVGHRRDRETLSSKVPMEASTA